MIFLINFFILISRLKLSNSVSSFIFWIQEEGFHFAIILLHSMMDAKKTWLSRYVFVFVGLVDTISSIHE